MSFLSGLSEVLLVRVTFYEGSLFLYCTDARAGKAFVAPLLLSMSLISVETIIGYTILLLVCR